MAAASLAVMAPAGPAVADDDLPPRVMLGAQQTGTLQHTLATAFATVVSDHASTTVVVQPFGGTTAIFPLLNEREIDLGYATSVDFAMAYRGPERIQVDGTNPYPESPDLRLVVGGAPLIASLIVRDESDIRSASDLKGRTIAGDFPAQLGARLNTFAHLRSADLTWDDVEVAPYSAIGDSLNALVDGRIEATVFGVGAPQVREADAAVGVRFASTDCSDEGIARFQQALPGYYPIELEGGSLPGVKEDLCTTAYDLYLVAHKDTPDAIVTAAVEAIWNNAEELREKHPVLSRWTRERALDSRATIPFHPAAIEAYKSLDAWSPEMDALQEELLGITQD